MTAWLMASLIMASGVTHAPYGTTKAGEPVERYVLSNAHGVKVGILTFGGIVNEISVPDGTGAMANVVLALPDLAAYEGRANFGSIVGRFANRISGGGYTLDGRRVDLADDKSATISHGGTPGFGAHVWQAEPCQRKDCRSVTLRYVSPDGENRFPGKMTVAVTYTLGNDNALRIDYVATSDKATVINLTNHSYFNLAGNASGNAGGQTLQVMADAFTPIDARKLPTGEIKSVSGTAFDFRKPAKIGDHLAMTDPQFAATKGFDHNFVLRKSFGFGVPIAARATDPVSGRTLEVRTTEPGLQVYTANAFNGTLKDINGRLLQAYDAYALETQHFPDSPNQPAFPTTVLRPGQTFRSTTIYRFGIRR